MAKQHTMIKPDDWHLHLRNGEMMRAILPHTTDTFRRALIMPNTQPPVLNVEQAYAYHEEILAAAQEIGAKFRPLMTIQIIEETAPTTISAAMKRSVIAGKIYPFGQTTNSENGVRDYRKLYPVFERMQKCGMILSLHGEIPDYRIEGLKREKEFLKILQMIATDFPELKIVLEHISDAASVECVESLGENVAATITVHHMHLTLDDVIGYAHASQGKLQAHHFCKPVAKSPKDRLALIKAANSGNPKFFYGGDSAAHKRGAKECDYGCAGVFNAPVALPMLTALFERHGPHNRLDKLENFVSIFGAQFYGLKPNEEKITLVKEKWVVPQSYGNIVPFMAGQTMLWKVQKST